MTTEALLAVANAYQAQVLGLRGRSIAEVAAIFDAVVVDPTDVTQRAFAIAAARAVRPLQEAAARAALTYIPNAVRSQGLAATATDLAASDYLMPRGVDTRTVFERPVAALRTGLARGKPFATAREEARSQAVQYAATEPMLSTRVAVHDAMEAEPQVVGYRRVPDASACSFCLLAATQRYHKRDLMPLHPSCGCTVAPILDVVDPGQVIDREALNRLKADGTVDDIARRRRGEDRRRKPLIDDDEIGRTVKPVTDSTDELGPTVAPYVEVDGKKTTPKKPPPPALRDG